jgi:ubiquinone/menaquinone biosynthesis C-methylase UbiE
MKIKNPEKRLKQFWGKVDQKHIKSFFPFIKGPEILDVGCGNGSTTHHIATNSSWKCTGIDYEEEAITGVRKLFPLCNFLKADGENLPFENQRFNTIILRDMLHHLYKEADFKKVSSELNRVAAPNATLIIVDPNVIFILKLMHKILKHHDPECSYKDACIIMQKLGYHITQNKFNTLFSLPLSGGYIGINFVPNISVLHSLLLFTEKVSEVILKALGLGRFFCLRYLVVGEISN